MAKKTKKNVRSIKDALLSNAGYIKQTTEDQIEDKSEEIVANNVHNCTINPELLDKFAALSEYENIALKEQLEKALNHYLKLKGLQLQEALKNR